MSQPEPVIYQGKALDRIAAVVSIRRLPNEPDWDMRQRIFPELYLKAGDLAFEVLLGISSGWHEDHQRLIRSMKHQLRSTKPYSRRRVLESFTFGFSYDPLDDYLPPL